MSSKNYHADQELNILILGPMGENAEDSGQNIGEAIRQILGEQNVNDILSRNNVTSSHVHIPDNFNNSLIIDGVLEQLDTADLVIVNITPKEGIDGTASPNAFYELGLVHALGIPYILLAKEGSEKVFYTGATRTYTTPDFSIETLKKLLLPLISKFINPEDNTDFSINEVTKYYGGMPIVDISAAVGLATGYYYNFVSRLLREGSFIMQYPELIKHVVIVRPDNVLGSYEQDIAELRARLRAAGLDFQNIKLEDRNDGRNTIWFEHVNGIVVDIPRTIYPLQISPRLLTMQDKLDNIATKYDEQTINTRLQQTSEHLLDRVEYTIRYHLRRDRERMRSSILHFTTLDEIVSLIKRLS